MSQNSTANAANSNTAVPLDQFLLDIPKLFNIRLYHSLLHENTVFGQSLLYYNECGSTQTIATELLSQAENKLTSGTAILTESQTAGRGRVEGRSWISEAAGNIYCTLILKLNDAQLLPKLNFCLAIAIAHSINNLTNHLLAAKIKWPNDIYINNKKVSGILIDCDCVNSNNFQLKIGFGINCLQNMQQISSAQDKYVIQHASSIQQELSAVNNKTIQLNQIRERLLAAIFNEFQLLLQQSDWNKIAQLYSQLDLTLNQAITVMPNKREDSATYYNAISKGINADGNLLVIKDGTDKPIALVAEEVGIKLK
jgi:biotin-[acetyl-CoA-carboxylase] ligase BirA-like protein